TEEPWSRHYRMYSYVTRELPSVVAENFPARPGAAGIFGHSMGGHGALVCALKNPDVFRSVSAFAPISAPTRVPWGEKAFSGYLGEDREAWRAYDASELVREHPFADGRGILVDQGLSDQFLEEQLLPEALEEACAEAGQPLTLNRREGYDHSYYFISTFMEDHIRHHAAALNGP
ncbi:MAG TPA: alpha/beta hydrolase-fold protein, partial [Rubrobacter sp.]|nr:alpha/beta hydrolase-fold protein [Rubrobacter sp.]